MKVTKYEHACLVLETEGGNLILDPGCFTNLPGDLPKLNILIITEEHTDHFHLDNVKKILKYNPSIEIYTTEAVVGYLEKEGIKAESIKGQVTLESNGFRLKFNETDHAPVYRKSPCISLAVKVNDDVFYPSDSYFSIPDEVKIVALPTSGPWYKIEQSVDFLNSTNSPKILATHNYLNSESGNTVAEIYIKLNMADKTRGYIFLEPGAAIEV